MRGRDHISEVIYIPFERCPLWLLNGIPTAIGACSDTQMVIHESDDLGANYCWGSQIARY
jgi:hypothetical protein